MYIEIAKNIPKRNTGILQNNLVDGCVLLDQEKATAYALNVTASLMWSHCDGHYTVEEIATIITEASNLPPDLIAENVTQTINNLHQHGLLYFV